MKGETEDAINIARDQKENAIEIEKEIARIDEKTETVKRKCA
jgi:hypothetical protein